MTLDNIQSYLLPGRHAHLVGIGGVSMCPLAEVLHGMGLKITGSDLRDGNAVEHLRSLGIAVEIGHKAENIAGADLLIRTAAAHDDNPEIEAARKAEIPVFERAQAWGFLMRAYPNAVCISGTHGKTTTTSMVTHITMAAGRDPTVMIGGTLPLLGSGHRVGGGDTIILEACEYCDSFLSFRPTVAVILNIDADHLDYFHDLARVERSFRDFAALVPPEGSVIANGDDENTMRALRSLGRRLLTFGFGEGSDVRAVNVRLERGGSSFDVIAYGKPYASIKLPVPGRHNVKNALAAAAVAVVLGIPGETAAKALSAFLGAGRRFEKKGTFRGADVYDDYAHHPASCASC
jgi:UDP-N-acetylmuramate--alanine ligase